MRSNNRHVDLSVILALWRCLLHQVPLVQNSIHSSFYKQHKKCNFLSTLTKLITTLILNALHQADKLFCLLYCGGVVRGMFLEKLNN